MTEIDDSLTSILLGAERCLGPPPQVNRTGHLSVELDMGLRKIAYWRRRGTAIDSSSVSVESIEVKGDDQRYHKWTYNVLRSLDSVRHTGTLVESYEI